MNLFSPRVEKGESNKTFDKEQEVIECFVNDFTCNNLKDIYERNYRLKLREKRKVVENDKPPPKYYLTELLVKEVEKALMQNSWVDNTGKRHFKDYHPFLYRNKKEAQNE